MKLLLGLFYILSTGLAGYYTVSEYYGWEAARTHKQRIDPNIRKSPGGFRSYTFWHQGVHGGK